MQDKLVTIANFSTGPDPATDAELARIKLESEGIQCFLLGQNFVSMYWLLSNADRGVKLQVRQCDAEKALKILQKSEPVDIKQTESEDWETKPINPVCPKCGSNDTEYEKYSKVMFFISILFLRFPLPFLKKKYKCHNCGHSWK